MKKFQKSVVIVIPWHYEMKIVQIVIQWHYEMKIKRTILTELNIFTFLNVFFQMGPSPPPPGRFNPPIASMAVCEVSDPTSEKSAHLALRKALALPRS